MARLSACGRLVSLAEDEVVFRAHEPSSHFYLLLTGSVFVEVRTPVHAICVQAVHPGEAFGWSSLLPSHQTMFQVRAQEASTAVCLDGEQLMAACEQDPSLGYQILRRLMEVVSRRLEATERRLAEFWGVGAVSVRRASQPCK
ncbi:MAG: cyclic nucleotide-binding domain-containing protein [Acidobacteria bacterium]|nr:cyclic nucleotide-binding domain-containing protein [Acidobacteriota bacterium]